MKYIIIGRTVTGKSFVAEQLATNGLSVLKTTTTRPPRTPDDEDYNFITAQEAAAIPETDKVLKTEINGFEYFTTMADLETCDAAVLDPEGFKELIHLMPGTSLHVVHCTCGNPALQKQLAIGRAVDQAAEAVVFGQRQTDEDPMFSKWEQDLANKSTFGMNTIIIHNFENDYTPDKAKGLIAYLLGYKKCFDNMKTIVEQCLALGVLRSEQDGTVNVAYVTPTPHNENIPIETFVDVALTEPQNLAAVITSWLSHDISIGVPAELADVHDDEVVDPAEDPFWDGNPDLQFEDDGE